nr:putative ribonuclease H-like domain-containing protein [Tanacetum cinerariifolium]
VEVHPRIPSVSNKMKSVTAHKDSLYSRTLNATAVCATCNKYLVDSNHFACVTKMMNDVHARTKKPTVVPISTRKPISQANKSIATPNKKKIVQLILFIVDSGYTKHMTGNLKLLCNFVEKFLGFITSKASITISSQLVSFVMQIWRLLSGSQHVLLEIFRGKGKSMDTKFDRPSVIRQPNAQRIPKPSVLGKPTPFLNSLNRIYFQKTESVPKANVSEGLSKPVTAQTLPQTAKKAFAPILGYGDLVQGNVTINRVYYVEGLNHNIFSVGQFYDADLEVAFKKSTCFVRDLQGNDLLTGFLILTRLHQPTFKHGYRDWPSKVEVVPSSKESLNLLYMDLCGPMRVASINGKKYILVIVDDYSRCTWTLFLRSTDETPEVLKDFLMMIQRNLQASVITVRTNRGTEFLNKTLNAFFKEEGIEHQTSTARTPEQNGVVERRNRTLVEARTMLSASQLPLFFWAEAIATA